MEQIQQEFLDVFKRSIRECTSQNIALSGGLDSSAIACMMEKRPTGYAVIAKDFVASDLTYCQIIASALDLPLNMITVSTERIISAMEETIKILRNFNDIEIRNSIVMYVVIDAIRESGMDSIITGDGADELFAGYDFMVKKPGRELQKDLKRVSRIMHFASKKIGDALRVRVESPFLAQAMIEFAGRLPVRHMVGVHQDRTYGKMIIRKSLQDHMPRQITWRPKTPMQDGAGTTGMTSLFSRIITDTEFHAKQKRIMEQDGVRVRTKESAIYYETFRRFFKPDRKDAPDACPDCGHVTDHDSRFCRMCGRFPI